MTLSPLIRKAALTAHVTASIGWCGAVAGFLVLAIAGLTSQDSETVRATYVAAELLATYLIVPLNYAALLTGIIQSLGTKWGLFRHYWVVVKLLITLVCTIVLLIHMQPIRYMAQAATEMKVVPDALRPLQVQLVVDAGAALLALLVTTVLSVYKPRGLTPYGWRKQQTQRVSSLTIDRAT